MIPVEKIVRRIRQQDCYIIQLAKLEKSFRLIATFAFHDYMFIEQPLWALSNAKYLEIKKMFESLELIKPT